MPDGGGVADQRVPRASLPQGASVKTTLPVRVSQR
jgi:hypothetical protein